jgi:site-specific recombinase XerD
MTTTQTPWRVLLPAFAMHQRSANLAPDTIRIYGYRLADVAAVHRHPDRITTADLERMIGEATGGVAKRKQMRAAYRVFFAWASRNGHLTRDPAADLPTIKAPEAEADPCPDVVG